MGRGQGNGGGWPSTTGNPSGGGRSNAPVGQNIPEKGNKYGYIFLIVFCACVLFMFWKTKLGA